MVSESDAAFYSFLCVMLSLYLLPSITYTIYIFYTKRLHKPSIGFLIFLSSILLSIFLFLSFVSTLQNVDTSNIFDPYMILKIPDTASITDIRKSYRQLSRQYHPDKNLMNTKVAAKEFTRITKAYEALTDPKGIENYQLYGHPDGPQSSFFNFAFLSAFSDSGIGFVTIYFTIVIAIIGYTVRYLLTSSSVSRSYGFISTKTIQIFQHTIHERMSLHDIIELLCTCEELTQRGAISSNEELSFIERTKAHEKVLKRWETAKILPTAVITRIKKMEDAIARENLIAIYFFLLRRKVQGISKPSWVDARFQKIILRFPYLIEHFANIVAKVSIHQQFTSQLMDRTITLMSSMMQGSLVADEVALSDQINRLKYLDAKLELPKYRFATCSLAVVDEEGCQPHDWLTLEFQLERMHLEKNETSAPLAVTVYDEIDPKSPFRKEILWITVKEKKSSRLVAAWKSVDLQRIVSQKVGFFAPDIPGAYEFDIQVTCVAYLNVQCSISRPIVVEGAKQ